MANIVDAVRSPVAAVRQERLAGGRLPPMLFGLQYYRPPVKFERRLTRKAAERTVDGLWNAIGRSIDRFTPTEC
jgi:hypothetical protein